MKKVKVGDVVRDTVTGFEGVAVARTEWLNKCVRIVIQPRKLHDGKPVESQSFDEEQVELVEGQSYALPAEKHQRTGGDRGPAESAALRR